VDDEATYLLMTRFAEHLKAHPPQEAIRRAMLDTRTKHPEPMLWASFAYFGHPVGELSR
jgi:CHAT domain-containing protein